MTAVIEGRTVLGLPREIQEVRNAFAAYEAMPDWDPASADDLLGAHGLLMRGLCDDAGYWRSGGVGIYRGEQLVHMAPPASQVPRLMGQLLTWLAETEAHPLSLPVPCIMSWSLFIPLRMEMVGWGVYGRR